MGVSIGPIALGSGGGVLGLGPAPNTFGDSTTADRAAAETLRDAQATADAAWLALYNGNLSFWIRLVWDTGVVEQRRNAAGTDWEDVTNVIRGRPGNVGSQGRFLIRQYQNAATEPAVPTDGTYNVDTDTLTPSTGWAVAYTDPGAGEETWIVIATVDPATQSGDITPTWVGPFRWSAFGRQGSFLIHVYQNAADRPATPTAGSYNIDTGALTAPAGWAITPTAPGAGEETWVSDAIINPHVQSGAVVPTWQVPYDRGAVSSLLTIIDVTGTGPPAASQATIPHLYLDTEIPRAWLTRTQRDYTTQPSGSWSEFTDPGNYLGAYRSVLDVPNYTTDQYFYLHGVVHSWYRATTDTLANQVSASEVLGDTATWLGDAPDRQTALDRIDNFDNARTYYFFNDDTGDVEVLDNTTYMAQTVNLSYAMIAIDLETDVAPWAHADDRSLIPANKLDLPNNADFAALLARVVALEGGETTGTIWFGWSGDRVIDGTDFANFNSVENMLEGTLPNTAADAYVVVAVPETDGLPDGIFIAEGANSFDGFTRQAGTIDDPDGTATIVLVSNNTLSQLFSGAAIRVEFPT